MGFVQTIAIETSDIGAVSALLSGWHAKQAGVAPGYIGNRILADRDQTGRYLLLVEFSSAEEAALNNERAETTAWAEALSSMVAGEAEFAQYDEV